MTRRKTLKNLTQLRPRVRSQAVETSIETAEGRLYDGWNTRREVQDIVGQDIAGQDIAGQDVS